MNRRSNRVPRLPSATLLDSCRLSERIYWPGPYVAVMPNTFDTGREADQDGPPPSPFGRPLRREEILNIIALVEFDFTRLVNVLGCLVDLAERSDKNLVEPLTRTKELAEQGLELSKGLMASRSSHAWQQNG